MTVFKFYEALCFLQFVKILAVLVISTLSQLFENSKYCASYNLAYP